MQALQVSIAPALATVVEEQVEPVLVVMMTGTTGTMRITGTTGKNNRKIMKKVF